MKTKKQYLTLIFLFISVLLAAIFIFLSARYEKENTHERNESLNYLSNMMKVLAAEIDKKRGDETKLTAAMIARSGAVAGLNEESREKVYEFLDGIIEEKIDMTAESAAFARRCSAAALYSIKGHNYELGDVLGRKEASIDASGGFDLKTTQKTVSKQKNITFFNFANDNKVCSRRSNVYFITNTDTKDKEEWVYVREIKAKRDINPISDDEALSIIFTKYPKKDFSEYAVVLSEDRTVFVRCIKDNTVYLFGVDSESRELSHVKILGS